MTTIAILDARQSPVTVLQMGENTAEATRQAANAAASAALAEAASGPTYASQALGEAATTTGQHFAVNAGAGIVTIYQRTAGGSTAIRTLATSAALAASTGATLVGANDAAGGTKWTTVQAFMNYVMSSAGSQTMGYQRPETGGLAQTVFASLKKKMYATDFSGGSWDGAGTDTTAMASAITAAQTLGETLYLPPKVKTGALSLSAPISIEGVGPKTEFIAVAGTYSMFTITASDVTVKNLYMKNAAKTGGVDFLYACGTNTLKRLTIQNVLTANSRGMFADSGTGAGRHISTTLRDFSSEGLNGPGVAMSRMYAYIFLENVSADYVGVATGNYTGFSFDGTGLTGSDVGGLTLTDLNVLGTAESYTTGVASQRGFYFKKIRALEMTRIKADGVGEYGYMLDDVGGVRADTVIGSQCASGQIYLKSVFDACFVNTHTLGRNLAGLTYKPSSKDGIYMESGCSVVKFNGGISRDNTGDGIEVAGTQSGGVSFGGMASGFNGGYGLRTAGTSSVNFVGGEFAGNTAGDYVLASSNQHISATQGNSGAMINV